MGTVLVVDDEFGIADLIDAVLTDEGHHVLTAANGRQGLELLSRERLDMVFLDYMMPIMDGAAVLRNIHAHPALQNVPIVLMSSMPETTVAQRCSGYVTFLHKPFRIGEVVALALKLMPKADNTLET